MSTWNTLRHSAASVPRLLPRNGPRRRFAELAGRLPHPASGIASCDRDGGAGDLDLGSVGADVDGELSGSPEVVTLMDGDGGG